MKINLKIIFLVIIKISFIYAIDLELQISQLLKQIKGKNVAFLTNPTGVDNQMNMLIDLVFQDKSINLKCFFAPEHGLRGNQQAGADVSDYIDPITGLPVYSLYGTRLAPTPEQLKDIDILVYYIQDTGTRFYTYIWTLTWAMQACAENGVTVMTFDRPNPLNANTVQGCPNTVNSDYVGRVFPGQKFGIPTRYGMTIGEFANLINNEYMEQKVNLVNISMINYSRTQYFDQTDQIWVMPSPNMPTLDTALVYPGIGIFEGTNISEGRGTTKPFEIVGGENIDSYELHDALTKLRLKGVLFRPAYFNPTFSKFQGKDCGGVEITVTDIAKYDSVTTGAYVLQTILKLYPGQFEVNNGVNRLFGIPNFDQMIQNQSVEEIMESCQENLDEFLVLRKRNLIYQYNSDNPIGQEKEKEQVKSFLS